jgi:hypothetical protein
MNALRTALSFQEAKMSFKKSLGLVSLCALVGAMTYGCSSTTTNGGGGGDDSGATGSDSGTHHDSGGTGMDSGGGGMDSGGGGDSAAMCAPGNVSSFTPPAYVPAARHAGACAGTDIADYYTACLDTTSTQMTCSTFTTAKAACSSCLEGPSTASSWTAVVDTPNGIASVNLGGCMELAGGANGLACAKSAQKADACSDAACSPTCKVTDDASLQLYEACAQQADANGCSTYAQALQTCETAEAATDGGDSICLTGQTFQDLYNAVAPVFCGP